MAVPTATAASGVAVVDAVAVVRTAMATGNAAIAIAKIVRRSLVRIEAIVRLATKSRKSMNHGATSQPKRKAIQPLMPTQRVARNLCSRSRASRNRPNPRSRPAVLKAAMKVKAGDAVAAVAVGVVVDAMGARVARSVDQAHHQQLRLARIKH